MEEIIKDTEISQKIKKLDILGFLMVIIPLISSIMIWYWFLFLDLVKTMNVFLSVVLFSTILLSSIVATIDSHRLGLKVQIFKKKNISGGKFLSFFVFLLLWPYSYPTFLLRRKNYGSRNLFIPLIISILIFLGSMSYIYYAVEITKAETEAYQNRKNHTKSR